MKRFTHRYPYLAASVQKAFLFILLIGISTQAFSQQNLTVIANQEGVPDQLSFKELKSVFMGEKQRWQSGKKVLIALLKTRNKVGIEVCSKVYNMKPDEMNKYWLALVFQGRASAPYFFNSADELLDFVAQNPGAIGIVDDSSTSSDIKIVPVDGKNSW